MSSQIAAKAALFVSAEWRGRIEGVITVDPNASAPQALRHTVREPEIARPNGGSKAVNRGVGDLDRFCRIAEANHAEHRAEDLLPRDAHVRHHIRKDGGLDEEALGLASFGIALASGEQAGALLLPVLDIVQNAIHLPPGDLRSDLGCGVERVSHPKLSRPIGELVQEA